MKDMSKFVSLLAAVLSSFGNASVGASEKIRKEAKPSNINVSPKKSGKAGALDKAENKKTKPKSKPEIGGSGEHMKKHWKKYVGIGIPVSSSAIFGATYALAPGFRRIINMSIKNGWRITKYKKLQEQLDKFSEKLSNLKKIGDAVEETFDCDISKFMVTSDFFGDVDKAKKEREKINEGTSYAKFSFEVGGKVYGLYPRLRSFSHTIEGTEVDPIIDFGWLRVKIKFSDEMKSAIKTAIQNNPSEKVETCVKITKHGGSEFDLHCFQSFISSPGKKVFFGVTVEFSAESEGKTKLKAIWRK